MQLEQKGTTETKEQEGVASVLIAQLEAHRLVPHPREIPERSVSSSVPSFPSFASVEN
jgi:hypothetical protein